MIPIRCDCGITLEAEPGSITCPGCGKEISVPEPAKSLNNVPTPPQSKQAESTAADVKASGSKLSPVFSIALVPLLAFGLFPSDNRERVEKSIRQHPELVSNETSVDTFLRALPDSRVPGALHGRDTWVHWVYALGAACIFLAAIRFLFPLGLASGRQLLCACLISGTVGILLLLGFQAVAEYTQRYDVAGGGIVMWIYGIVQFIGYSYRAAADPHNSFFMSLVGFTFGVGLCEEFFKALPLIFVYRRGATLDLRGAVAWGLALGAGFGVSEGIIYSGDFYNGISTARDYAIRFTSCVALHSIWTGTAALFVWKLQNEISGPEKWTASIFPSLCSIALSIIFHSLYDTFLRRDLDVLAILMALASFAAFFWLFARYQRNEQQILAAQVS